MKDYYLKQFSEIYDGPTWYGDAYMDKLKNINEEQAFAKPSENIHSIAELVSHNIYWRDSLLNVLKGNIYSHSEEDPDNWIDNQTLKSRGWGNLKEMLHLTQDELLKHIKAISEEELGKKVRKDLTVEDLIIGVIQHDVYHLGQIGLVIKIISSDAFL